MYKKIYNITSLSFKMWEKYLYLYLLETRHLYIFPLND